MGQKLFFMVVFLLIVGGIGFLIAFTYNVLPSSVYTFVYNNLRIRQQSAALPYLQKFEGHWSATLTPSAQWSDVHVCAQGTGTLTIHNGEISGAIGPVANRLISEGEVDEMGNVSGSFGGQSLQGGTFFATLSGMEGQGSWKNGAECSGVITFQKLEPVNDPVAGMLLNFAGGVTLLRGSTNELPMPHIYLYEGDALVVPPGGSITVTMRGEQKTITGPITYSVTTK